MTFLVLRIATRGRGALAPPRGRRILEQTGTLRAEVDELRQRVDRLERHLGPA